MYTLKGNETYLANEQNASYQVVDGDLIVYAVCIDSNGKMGRRYFIRECSKGDRIPWMYLRCSEDETWYFSFSTASTCIFHEIDDCPESMERNFLDGINGLVDTMLDFSDCIYEYVNMRRVSEEGIIYASAEEKESLYRKGLFNIYQYFKGKKRTFHYQGTGNTNYDTVNFICKKLNINIISYDTLKEVHGRRFTIEDIARLSHFTVREVMLEENWYLKDSGTLIVYNGMNYPIACIPQKSNQYIAYNLMEDTAEVVTEEVAKEFKMKAKMLYRPFPNEEITLMGLVKFGLQGVTKSDIFNFFFLSLVGTLIGVLIPYLNQKIFDEYIQIADKQSIISISVLILAFTIGNLSFTVVKNLAIFRFTNAMTYSIQNAIFDRLFNLPSSFFNKMESVDIAKRAISISALFHLFSEIIISTVLSAIFSIVYLISMYRYSKELATLGVLMVFADMLITLVFGIVQVKYEKKLIGVKTGASTFIYQMLSGIAKLRIAGAENRALLKYIDQYLESRRITQKKEMLKKASINLNSIISICFVMVFYYTVAKGTIQISYGIFIAFTSAFSMYSKAMIEMVAAFLNVNHALPTYKRAKCILQTVKETEDNKEVPALVNGRIEIDNVSFAYSRDSEMVLDNISMSISPGEYIGIVGTSGSGKSTLLKLLLGFEKPSRGKIYYDSKDIDGFDKRELRKKMGVVLQDGQLISGSIYENITITCSEATEKIAKKAVEAVGLQPDLDNMPMGLHTVIAEGAGTISGGQRQKILIARAIINEPKIMLFDEATSALDNVNQSIVCESLEKLKATRIVIAHRLSTIIKCDRIFVMDKGKIIEQGSYQELMELKGSFYNLSLRQNA